MIGNQSGARVEGLYQKYSDMVYRIGMLYMRDEQEACDIVQDVFLKLLCHPKRFGDEEHEKAWILRVAINRCKDQLKTRWRKKRVSWNEYQKGAETRLEDEGDEKQIVISAVMELPDIYKDVIFLFYYEGYKTEEIAQIIHRNPSTVRSRLQKARELLKESLKGDLL